MNPEERYVDVDGLPTRYLRAGTTGPPLVLLHGVGDSALDWQWVMPMLARTHRVYALDLPGSGGSIKPDVDYSPAFFTQFLSAFLDASEIEHAAVVGNSLGGLVGLRLALSEPSRVSALALVASTGLGREVTYALRSLALPGSGRLAVAWGKRPPGAAQRTLGRSTLLFARPWRVPRKWLKEQYRRLAEAAGIPRGSAGHCSRPGGPKRPARGFVGSARATGGADDSRVGNSRQGAALFPSERGSFSPPRRLPRTHIRLRAYRPTSSNPSGSCLPLISSLQRRFDLLNSPCSKTTREKRQKAALKLGRVLVSRNPNPLEGLQTFDEGRNTSKTKEANFYGSGEAVMSNNGRRDEPSTHASSTGQALTASGWLDTHFEACRPEYETMLSSVGIEPGWRVLDAGCGSGSYLPLLTELVGRSGHVAALDLASDNIALVEKRLSGWDLPCPVEARTASLRALPYPDDAFDAVWCANTTLHFGNEELPSVLAELRRVVRPGGLVAVKDLDTNLLRFYPADPFLVFHLSESGLRTERDTAESIGSLRGRELRRWLERSGLTEVWQRTTLIERWAPLRPVERQFFGDWLIYLAGLAEERGVPKADLAAWRSVRDPEAPDYLLDHPEFYACEGQIVAVGRVPGGGP